MPSKITQTALGSVEISDSLTDLMSAHYLPVDVETAAQVFPVFRFDPVRDAEFYNSCNWWHAQHDTYVSGAEKVLKRFQQWYQCAPDMARVLLTFSALTDSSEQFDSIIDDAMNVMSAKFQIQMQDADDSIFSIEDFHAMRDENNINEAILTPRNQWWCRQIEQQCQRITNTPAVPFEKFKHWNTIHEAERKRIEDQFRNVYHDNLTNKQTRRIFNRSLALFNKFFDEFTARKFIHGKNLWIRGKHFVWRLKMKPREIIRSTVNPSLIHTPFRIAIYDQDCNRLADACVLFERTPILEQAISIKIWLADDEMVLLNKTNIFSFTEAGRANTLLTSLPHALIEQAAWETPTRVYNQMRVERNPNLDDDPSLDDGPNLDVSDNESDDRFWDWNHRPEQEWSTFTPDLNNPYDTAFAAEDIVKLSSNISDILTYRDWITQSRYVRHMRAANPVAVRMREKLLSQIDADPEILHYMQFPEFHTYFLNQIDTPTRLSNYISFKTSLLEHNSEE